MKNKIGMLSLKGMGYCGIIAIFGKKYDNITDYNHCHLYLSSQIIFKN